MSDISIDFDNLTLFNLQSIITNYDGSQRGKLLMDLKILPEVKNYRCVSNCGGIMTPIANHKLKFGLNFVCSKCMDINISLLTIAIIMFVRLTAMSTLRTSRDYGSHLNKLCQRKPTVSTLAHTVLNLSSGIITLKT